MSGLDDLLKSQQRIADLSQKASSMSTDDLKIAYQETYRGSSGVAPTAESDPFETTANLIATRPGDSLQNIAQRESDQDFAQARARAREDGQVYLDELHRRGLEPDWRTSTAYDMKWATYTGPDPHLDTGHYDDGHSFGWKRPEPQPASADPHLDTGHYDDGHAFGWKSAATPAAPAKTSALPVPAPVLAAGGAVVIVVAVVGFALARGGATPAASSATSGNVAAASIAAKPATNAPGIICADAPPLSLALTGAATGTVKKGCVPTLSHPGQQTSPSTPYCRLQGIPNPPNTVAGVLAVAVAFVNGTTRFEMTMSYVADSRDQVNHGTLPATVVIDPNVSATGTAGLTSWPATSELPGTQGARWNAQTGRITFDAGGATGTIDMTYRSAGDGSTMTVKGNWQVPGGCPVPAR